MEKLFSRYLQNPEETNSTSKFTHLQRDFSLDTFYSRIKFLANRPVTPAKSEPAKAKKGAPVASSSSNILDFSKPANFMMISDRAIPLIDQRAVLQATAQSKIYESIAETSKTQLAAEMKTCLDANILYVPAGLCKKEDGSSDVACLDFVALASNTIEDSKAKLSILMDGGLSSPSAVLLMGKLLGPSTCYNQLRSVDFEGGPGKEEEQAVIDIQEGDQTKAMEVSPANDTQIRIPTLDILVKLAKDRHLVDYKKELYAIQTDPYDWSTFYGSFKV